MNNKILGLIFVSFTKLKMPVQNKVLREGKKKKKPKNLILKNSSEQ